MPSLLVKNGEAVLCVWLSCSFSLANRFSLSIVSQSDESLQSFLAETTSSGAGMFCSGAEGHSAQAGFLSWENPKGVWRPGRAKSNGGHQGSCNPLVWSSSHGIYPTESCVLHVPCGLSSHRNQHSYPDRAPKGTCGYTGLRLHNVPKFSDSV